MTQGQFDILSEDENKNNNIEKQQQTPTGATTKLLH